MTELEVRVTVAAPPEAVWRDWTDAAMLATWFWPPRLEAEATINRAEGIWRIHSPVAGMGVRARIRMWEEPTRLELTWRWDGEEPQNDLVVCLEQADAGTAVTVRHGPFDRATERDEHERGWTDCLARLVDRHRG